MPANGFEFYETPQAFGSYLFRTVDIRGRLFEPCVGAGAIIRAHGDPTVWRTNDLDPRHPADTHLDAEQPACWAAAGPIDWTVTNPHFSGWMKVLQLALEHSRVGVALHLRASVHEVLRTTAQRKKDGTPRKRSADRRTFMRRHTPTGILWLPRFGYQRSITTGKWSTDSVCACWVVWVKDPARAQFIDYAPEWVLEALDAETPEYRACMDALAMADRALQVFGGDVVGTT